MLLKYGQLAYRSGSLLRRFRDATERYSASNVPFPAEEMKPYVAQFEAVAADPGDFADFFPSFLAQIRRMIEVLKVDTPAKEYAYLARALDERFLDDIERHWCYLVRNDLVEYHQSPLPFGPEVSEKFPSAIDDVEGAAKCLALGQGTATVLHLMRVLEVGLKALSNALGIPYAPSWESHLSQIQRKVADKHRRKGIRWKRDEKLFLEISGDLVTIKQAWRNPTMHVGRKYSPEEAEEIFGAVKRFMTRMSGRFSEAK